MNINNLVKSVFRKIGVDIRLLRNIEAHKRKTYEEKWVDKCNFLRNYNIRTIIDIGANVGQFATLIRKVLPEAKIYTFEPLKDCFYELQVSLKSFPNYKAFNLALGNFKGECEINSSEFSPSSSLLEMTDLHKQNWSQSGINKKKTIKIDRLDNVLTNENLVPEIFIKIDVQGYEENVIRGG